MIILAHRGWWLTPAEKNTRAAILRAFESGYGVETDVRDHDGELVLAHDMPTGANLIPFEWVIEAFAKAGQPGALAVNVKADGLHIPLADMLGRHGVDRAFVFDMAVPDSLGYLSRGISTFTRHSEIEPHPAFYAEADGVWIDCFHGDWIDAGVIEGHLDAGKRPALVSPELHGRSHEAAWQAWAPLARDARVMICTDLPKAFEAFAGGQD